MRATIDTRVGHIGDDDNRFLGRSVFGRMPDEVRSLGDALALALGVSPDDDDREVFRLIALCTTSPDARVWPLKLCRLLASWGDPVVGMFGAQLISAGKIMGPGTAAECAAALCFVADAVDGHPDPERVGVALDTWRASHGGRVAGFGVPFRPEDERLLGLRRLVRGTPLEQRPHWRLQERVVAAMATRSAVQPNVVLGLTAMLLDVGVAPERCGLAVAVSMPHLYVAHALEAVADGRDLNDLPAEVVEYAGVGPRSTADPVPPRPAVSLHTPPVEGANAYARAGGAE